MDGFKIATCLPRCQSCIHPCLLLIEASLPVVPLWIQALTDCKVQKVVILEDWHLHLPPPLTEIKLSIFSTSSMYPPNHYHYILILLQHQSSLVRPQCKFIDTDRSCGLNSAAAGTPSSPLAAASLLCATALTIMMLLLSQWPLLAALFDCV